MMLMKYKTRFLAFFVAMTLFSLSANYAHPVTPTIIQDLGLHDYMFGLALATMMIANFLFSPFGERSICIFPQNVLCAFAASATVWPSLALPAPLRN